MQQMRSRLRESTTFVGKCCLAYAQPLLAEAPWSTCFRLLSPPLLTPLAHHSSARCSAARKYVSRLRETTLSYKNDALVHAKHYFERAAQLLKTVCAEHRGVSCRCNAVFVCKFKSCREHNFDKCTLAHAKAPHLLETAVSPTRKHHF